MPASFGERVDNDHSDHDKADAGHGNPVQPLLEHHDANDGREYDAEAAPDCIGDTERQGPERLGQQVKRYAIQPQRDQRRRQFAELLGFVQKTGGRHFAGDGSTECCPGQHMRIHLKGFTHY